MKKSKFIELLNKLPGDVEIKFWNGFVGDWVDLDPVLVPVELVKQTESDYIERVRIEQCIDENNNDSQLSPENISRLKKSYKKGIICRWEENQFVTKDDIKEGRYKAKTVYMLQAKAKGIRSWDRLSSIDY